MFCFEIFNHCLLSLSVLLRLQISLDFCQIYCYYNVCKPWCQVKIESIWLGWPINMYVELINQLRDSGNFRGASKCGVHHAYPKEVEGNKMTTNENLIHHQHKRLNKYNFGPYGVNFPLAAIF